LAKNSVTYLIDGPIGAYSAIVSIVYSSSYPMLMLFLRHLTFITCVDTDFALCSNHRWKQSAILQ